MIMKGNAMWWLILAVALTIGVPIIIYILILWRLDYESQKYASTEIFEHDEKDREFLNSRKYKDWE